jgi:hypothetical protein
MSCGFADLATKSSAPIVSAHELVELGSAAGEHHDGNLDSAEERACHILAIGARKAQVQHHGIGLCGKDIFRQVVEALERRDLMSCVLEQERELGAYGRVVLDQADLCHLSS